jgi:hypothetical protein
MLTLSPELQAAQDGTVHRPIVEIIASQGVNIPFEGLDLTGSSSNEISPSIIAHSSGALASVFVRASRYVVYGYTDASRTTWTYVTLDLGYNHTGAEAALCELADGTVGIVYTDTVSGTTSTKYRVVTLAGVDLAPAVTGTIFSQSSSVYMSGPAVVRRDDDTVIMVYALYDGSSHYHLYSRTSGDFASWSLASEIDTSPVADTKRKGNPSLLLFDTDKILLSYDALDATGPAGEELTNCYYQILSGASWSAAQAYTTYTDYYEVASHPAAALKSNGDIVVAWTVQRGSLKMSSTAVNWRGTNYTKDLHYDPVTQLLYSVQASGSAAGGFLGGIEQIDITTWEVTNSWDTGTTPAIVDDGQAGGWKQWKGAGKYVLAGFSESILNVIDTESDSVTTYYFKDITGHPKNVNWDDTPGMYGTVPSLEAACVDLSMLRVYCLFASGYPSDKIQAGYLDLTETPGSGVSYTYTEIYTTTSITPRYSPSIRVYPSSDIAVLNWADGPYLTGLMLVVTISTPGLLKWYSTARYPDFPQSGLRCYTMLSDGKIYGGFTYVGSGAEAAKRGLCIIDMGLDRFEYKRPTWASVDEYGLQDVVVTEDENLLFTAYGYGVTLYDIDVDTWTIYDNTTIPGLTTGNTNFYQLDYDPATHMVFVAVQNYGVIAFSMDGALIQPFYTTGTVISGTFSGTTPDNLVQGYSDYGASLAVASDALYAVWTEDDDGATSTMWDVDTTYNLGSYLMETVTASEELDAMECVCQKSLKFTLSRGDLFDPTNASSLFRDVVTVGSTITARFGEYVSGASYWQDVGTYIVAQNPMSYGEKGTHPTMTVTAEDPSFKWEQGVVTTTQEYSAQYVEEVLTDLVNDFGDVDLADISLGTWAGRTAITHQWVTMSLKDIVAQICQRYGYFLRFEADGTVGAHRINPSATPSHVYSDLSSIVKWSPGKQDNDLVNRVIVEGEELSYVEVLTAEERVASFNASHRWNTGSKEYQIWYSDDRSRRCRYPRMVASDSVTSLAFDLAGSCSEELRDDSASEADPNMQWRYCTIAIDSPDLTPEFVVALGALVFSYFVPDIWDDTPWVKRLGSYLSAAATFVALNILAATGNFTAEVWAQPIGYVRRKVQSPDTGDNNDYLFQQKIGKVITDKSSHPLCYSAGDCSTVATHRMNCHHYGRNPISFEKTSHLQDEVGDVITVPHPVSGTVSLMVTKLDRSYRIPSAPGDEGTCIDSIEGWVVG